MRGSGEFMFKCVDVRDAGRFTNERGQTINYDMCYVGKFDEVRNDGIEEVKFKFSPSSKEMIDYLRKLQPYTKVKIDFDIKTKNNNFMVTPVNIVKI